MLRGGMGKSKKEEALLAALLTLVTQYQESENQPSEGSVSRASSWRAPVSEKSAKSGKSKKPSLRATEERDKEWEASGQNKSERTLLEELGEWSEWIRTGTVNKAPGMMNRLILWIQARQTQQGVDPFTIRDPWGGKGKAKDTWAEKAASLRRDGKGKG